MDTRVGYPNEHMAGDSDPEVTSPLYATAVGLVLNNLENNQTPSEIEENPVEENIEQELEDEMPQEETIEGKSNPKKAKFFDAWAEKFRNFLDNAE